MKFQYLYSVTFVFISWMSHFCVHGFAPSSSPSSLLLNHIDSKQSSSLSMFTGIVEEMGEVVKLEQRDDMVLWDGSTGKGTELTVKANIVMDGAYLG